MQSTYIRVHKNHFAENTKECCKPIQIGKVYGHHGIIASVNNHFLFISYQAIKKKFETRVTM